MSTRTTDNHTPVEDKTAKWCNSFVIAPKPKGTIYLSLEPERLTQAIIGLVYMGPTTSDIFSKLANACFLTLIDNHFNIP